MVSFCAGEFALGCGDRPAPLGPDTETDSDDGPDADGVSASPRVREGLHPPQTLPNGAPVHDVTVTEPTSLGAAVNCWVLQRIITEACVPCGVNGDREGRGGGR